VFGWFATRWYWLNQNRYGGAEAEKETNLSK
jgi:hypothetical protein